MRKVRIVLFVLALMVILPSRIFAQDLSYKDRRLVILWDVTLSMKGFDSQLDKIVPESETNIYDKVVGLVKKFIDRETAPSTKIFILPFQDKILPGCSNYATEAGKAELKKFVDEYRNEDVTRTNIGEPLEIVGKTYLTDETIDQVIILTDGLQNVPNSKDGLTSLQESLANFCRDKDKFDRAYYVALTKEAISDKLMGLFNNDICIQFVDSSDDFEGLVIVNAEVKMPTIDLVEETSDVAFDCIVARVVTQDDIPVKNGYELKVSCDCPYFSVNGTVRVNDGKIVIHPFLKMDVAQIRQDVLSQGGYFKTTLKIEDVADVSNANYIISWLNDRPQLEIVAKPEKRMEIAPQSGRGKAKSHKKFLWSKERNDAMSFTLNYSFSEDAIEYLPDGESIVLAAYTDSKCTNPLTEDLATITVNGEKTGSGGMFSISKSTMATSVVVTMQFDDNTKDREASIYFKVVDNAGLDRINGVRTSELPNPIIFKYDVKQDVGANPLKVGVIWGLIILGIFLLTWILFMHLIVNPPVRFKLIYITYPDGSKRVVRAKGAYKVVCTKRRRSCSIFHTIFVGKIVYETHSFWTNDLTIKTGFWSNSIQIAGRNYMKKPAVKLKKEMNVEITNPLRAKATINCR